MIDTSDWIKCDKCGKRRPQSQFPVLKGGKRKRCQFCIPKWQDRFPKGLLEDGARKFRYLRDPYGRDDWRLQG